MRLLLRDYDNDTHIAIMVNTLSAARGTGALKRAMNRYLRINGTVTCPVARLATGLRVYALTGRDLHPLDE